MVSKTFLRLAGVLTCLALTHCTFEPIYKENSSAINSGSLSVKANDPVFAFRLKKELAQQLAALPDQSWTLVRVNIDLSQNDLVYHQSNYAIRSQVRAQVSIHIERPNCAPKNTQFTEVTSFELDQNEAWINTQSRESAYERLLSRINDLIIQEISLLFPRSKTQKKLQPTTSKRKQAS